MLESNKIEVKQSLGHYERKQHMLWADEDSLKFVERRNRLILHGYRNGRKVTQIIWQRSEAKLVAIKKE